MRINPDSTPDLLASIERSRRVQQIALEQIASGRKINRPSDDPAASALLVLNASRSSQDDEFLHSVSSLRSLFQVADSSLNDVVTQLQRAITLGVEGANGTQTPATRSALAGEVNGIFDNLLSAANLSFNGNYVFAGTATDTPPFVRDATSSSGVRYVGNEQVNQVQIAENRTIAINLSGSKLFAASDADLFQSLSDLQTALQTGDTAQIGTATDAVRGALDQVNAQRVFYGNSLNQLNGNESFLNTQQLQWSTQENELAGADPAETYSRFVNAQTATQATLSAAAKLMQISLLDYLK